MGGHQSIGRDDRQIVKALCFSFSRHLAQQAPRNPNPVGFFEWGHLFAECSSYSYDSFLNRPRSGDRATFKTVVISFQITGAATKLPRLI
jgi:hypothetical protein